MSAGPIIAGVVAAKHMRAPSEEARDRFIAFLAAALLTFFVLFIIFMVFMVGFIAAGFP